MELYAEYGMNWILVKVTLGVRTKIVNPSNLILGIEADIYSHCYPLDVPSIAEFIMESERRMTTLDSID